MPLRFLDESGFSLGMIRDVPSWQIPPGGVYDSMNMIYDTPGVVRMRKGTSVVSSGSASIGTSIGFVYSQDATPIEAVYCLNGKTGNLTWVSPSGGGSTSLGVLAPTGVVGRPARHFGFLVFPINANAQVTHGALSVAGEIVATTFTNAVASTLTAGNPQITLTGADVTTNVKVGAVVRCLFQDVALTNWAYWGRVVSIDTTKLFTVWPTPTVTGTSAIGSLTTGPVRSSAAGGTCAASFQNRLLIGNTMDLSASSPVRNDRRVIYSILPTETSGGNIGATFVDSGSWPKLNYFDVPGADPIIAIEPVSGNQLLILTTTRPYVFSGNLVSYPSTQTTSPTITFDLSEVPGNGTCISDLGVQHTTRGVVWAGYGGIYAWDGRDPIDLTDKKINTYWRAKVRGSSFALHGSAYVRGHYIVSYTSGGVTEALCVNLSNLAWTRLQNPATDVFLGAARPTDPSQVFAVQWWDQTGTAPTWTSGQVERMESIFDPDVVGAGGSDPDAVINFSATTRPIVGDPETQKIQQRCTLRYQGDFSATGSPAVTVTAQSKIDAADIDAASVRTLGTLAPTSSLAVVAVTNASPINIHVGSIHYLQDGDFVDINGVVGTTNANGRWRVHVTSAGFFDLIGSTGNGAYVSGGTVKKVTESDFLTSSLDPGQAVSFNLTSATRVNSFQLQGIRVGFFEKRPVMSA